MKWIKKIQYSFSAKLSFYVLLSTITIFLISFLFFSVFTGRTIRDSAHGKAKNLLAITQYKIENVFTSIKTVHNNFQWAIIDRGIEADSLFSLTRDILESNPYIFGCAVAFEPHYFEEKGYYFSPFSSRQGEEIETIQLGTEQYDYFSMEWYAAPKRLNSPYWTDPYYDEGGGQMLMTTFSTPLYDREGAFIGVLTADVSLDWLTDLVNEVKPYPSSYSVLLAHNGTYIIHPRKEYIMHESIFSVAERFGIDALKEAGTRMTNGESGMAELENTSVDDYIKSYIYYTALPSNGWSLGMVTHKKEIFWELRKTRIITLLFFLIGLLFLYVLCRGIVHKLSKPLSDFSHSAREIARGNFHAELPHIKSKDEMMELKNSFSFMQQELVNYTRELKETTSKKERIESELHIAREIQMGMIPKIFPPFPDRNDLDLFALLRPAKEVGGDLYDFFIDNDRLYFAIGDVSDKGVPASLFMAVTRSLFRSVATHYDDPAQIVLSMNNSIAETNDANMFVTLFIGILNLSTGTLSYCNAGHNPPVLITPEGKVSFMKVKPNMAVGLFDGFPYQFETMTIEKGSTLFLYTDGLTEAENREQALYHETRLIQELENAASQSPRELIHTIVESVNRHVNGAEQSDDLTILAIHYIK
ncbi:sigma-B regulation protein RsbU (phosphoserine phosphatase) [Parabacteroides sp. PFB2-12]|uniref:SpoIIE family protein phosphatase n=1 Tax=unclassified Parabacteroides TaxID=2649774 RepID=UPI002476E0B1|nr:MULTISPECIES: SpoIIE family protein phosphatase [unclassified Parabacteroides]MDH6342236.1 sigma-B regulation protein RsbU (phosphoserine phosphatase) [Parabacteroides sp. PM6-13]MDH6391080.1 sigma-B regulation protein RsbU (phosphoserine phosphatase) [Parabacteroides sp. PFB2-12]